MNIDMSTFSEVGYNFGVIWIHDKLIKGYL